MPNKTTVHKLLSNTKVYLEQLQLLIDSLELTTIANSVFDLKSITDKLSILTTNCESLKLKYNKFIRSFHAHKKDEESDYKELIRESEALLSDTFNLRLDAFASFKSSLTEYSNKMQLYFEKISIFRSYVNLGKYLDNYPGELHNDAKKIRTLIKIKQPELVSCNKQLNLLADETNNMIKELTIVQNNFATETNFLESNSIIAPHVEKLRESNSEINKRFLTYCNKLDANTYIKNLNSTAREILDNIAEHHFINNQRLTEQKNDSSADKTEGEKIQRLANVTRADLDYIAKNRSKYFASPVSSLSDETNNLKSSLAQKALKH